MFIDQPLKVEDLDFPSFRNLSHHPKKYLSLPIYRREHCFTIKRLPLATNIVIKELHLLLHCV